MRSRKLRIAWSVVSGLACVLLIVLWVIEPYDFHAFGCGCQSTRGVIIAYKFDAEGKQKNAVASNLMSVTIDKVEFRPINRYLGFDGGYVAGLVWYAQLPYWFLVAMTAILATSPFAQFARCRFSLRTLLIATTLVAVVLGLIVYLSTKPPASPPIDHVDVPEF